MENQIITGLDSYLTFQIGREKFAVNIGYIKKIIEMVPITRVPHAPDLYLGVINLFGEVLPVIDGRLKFGLTKKEADENTCIMILMIAVEEGIQNIGMVVDQVLKVTDIAEKEMNAAPDIGKKFRFDCIRAVAKVNGEFILVLNPEKLFSSDELNPESIDN